ncbi:purine-nucleoside phosphorylase [Kineococcus radiotolerans]|uniref:Purine nucleoside phosphorylase n=1 Tax=Kineococcus radiotolerans (strain ATCC BAA-149 / DSM 14245 / SRS30216) TaxID=266940 RepID=A6WEZ4_KINRD|nr:purine-nucleoside phosphorylase [Kineococcus radiotolerans]ABS05383.1 purine nucleotide phosphorylase [Kineococcus radiotolerans SRS30216 = ATCC BAA-149]
MTSPAAPDARDPFTLAAESAARLAELSGVARHDVALVLGSGWAAAADRLGETVAALPATDLPGFLPPAVVGHAGTVRSIAVPRPGSDPLRALVLPRSHFYEGHGVRAVAHGVRVAAAAGCRTIVLTNGCGGLDPAVPPGSPVLISDHLNLTGASPLEGATFVDVTDLYSTRLRGLARTVDPDLAEGVYAQFRGPQYETPAEVRMAGVLGASLVGMSTALEAVAARHVGLEVLGFSLVTNLAAGVSDRPLSHEEVLEAGRDAAGRCADLLAGIVPLL